MIASGSAFTRKQNWLKSKPDVCRESLAESPGFFHGQKSITIDRKDGRGFCAERVLFGLQIAFLAMGVLLLSVYSGDWRVGLALGVGWLLVAAGWMRTWMRRLEKQDRERSVREQLELLSWQRHDWLNHLQVLMGFTSLNKPERMSSIARTGPPIGNRTRHLPGGTSPVGFKACLVEAGSS